MHGSNKIEIRTTNDAETKRKAQKKYRTPNSPAISMMPCFCTDPLTAFRACLGRIKRIYRGNGLYKMLLLPAGLHTRGPPPLPDRYIFGRGRFLVG